MNWFSQRSLTIYLWHGVALYIIFEADLPGSTNLIARLAWCAVLLPLAVVLFGWAEDLAAKRPVQLWPRLPQFATEPGLELRHHRPAGLPPVAAAAPLVDHPVGIPVDAGPAEPDLGPA